MSYCKNHRFFLKKKTIPFRKRENQNKDALFSSQPCLHSGNPELEVNTALCEFSSESEAHTGTLSEQAPHAGVVLKFRRSLIRWGELIFKRMGSPPLFFIVIPVLY